MLPISTPLSVFMSLVIVGVGSSTSGESSTKILECSRWYIRRQLIMESELDTHIAVHLRCANARKDTLHYYHMNDASYGSDGLSSNGNVIYCVPLQEFRDIWFPSVYPFTVWHYASRWLRFQETEFHPHACRSCDAIPTS